MYDEFMSEYLELGHMELVHEVSSQPTCYIPHHGVYKESTAKLRIVFNASRKYKSGTTLNDCHHVGPKLQSELSAIILKWRTHRIGFMADIEKCYRQILVQRDDADMQRIIWKDEEGRPAVYRLLTVTYGLNFSPYVTIKVLHTLANDEEANFPQAAKVLRESFYMDDCLHGADSVEAAQQLQLELQNLLQRGGFLLRKWNSNSTEFLQGISVYDKLTEQCCDLNLDRETKALGIYWFCQTDCIGYKVNVTKLSTPITKRQQLSDVAKIYDPTCLLAPVKITVPCLELNGALLASKVASKVLDTLQLPSITIYCWSDSKTTLSWIRSNPGKHKQYVANRITKIQELTTIDCWRYVPTKSNPADIASRGVYPSQLHSLDLWWSGPTWLQKDEGEWPEQKFVVSDVQEVTTLFATHRPSKLTEDKMALGLLYKYSDINTLIGVTCWCYCYIAIKLKQPHATSSWCTASERQAALQFWIRYVQRIHFTNEISCLLQGKPVSSKSKLMKLNPMIDDTGIVRLNGRLKNALLTVSERFPIILPKESKLTSLLIDQAHNATMHGGKQTTINFLRRRYWIIDCRSSVQKFIRRCLICCRHKPQPTTQFLGILPTPRCTAAAPFKHSGLDYAGPYAIRTTKGRGHRSYKGWVALFVCLSIRAIHLELVSDMTTETLLAALRRFFSQRGYSSSIYSDCATTFVSANAVLKQDFTAYQKQLEAGARSVSCHGVSWHFIPPGSPNFGGIWEAGVKSMKHHLKRTIGEATLTFEEFYTVIKQIEAVLNSRPISALSVDTGDFAALTPGHFLVGGPITATPEPDLIDIKTGRLSRWKQLQQMQQDFWKRWSCEYLHDLQVRSKWQKSKANIKVGDLVLVKDERAPPTQWLLGRVLEVHTGEDDLVRVATIRTQSSIIKRAISKLVVLPVDNDSADEHGGRPDVSSQ
ncbi:uncharacterized protein LOC129954087 [Eupeodes corollae]|uniref:uncharacterized protein LOC129954087 n=1 Tax=Eupeodes corollae TaxID=290404 RepID=UPI0024933F49|nr:uncharacterized protein LOC129954087 [Eupeodes corollae]